MLDTTTIVLYAALFATISAVGYTRLASLLLSLYDHIFGGASLRDYRQKWSTLHALRLEISTISAQDEFARWARLQRRIDASQQEWDKATQERSRAEMTGKMKLGLGLRVGYAVAMAAVMWRWRVEEAVKVPVVWRVCGERAVSVFGRELIKQGGHVPVYVLFSIIMQAVGRVVAIGC